MQEKGDEKSWNVMLNRFMNEQNAQEKRKLLSKNVKNFLTLLGEVLILIYLYTRLRRLGGM